MTQTEIVCIVCASSEDGYKPGHLCCLMCLRLFDIYYDSYTFVQTLMTMVA